VPATPRVESILKAVIVVALVGLLVVAGLFVRYVVTGGLNDTPKTEAERGVVAAEQAVRANPKDAIARVKLAAAYLSQKSPRRALEQAKIAVRLAPKEPSAYYVLGLAQSSLGQNKEAVASLTKAVKTKGQLAGFYMDAYVALARAQEREGKMKDAETSLSKAINNGPENSLLLFERGQFYERQKNWQMALYDYGWALTYTPNFEEARTRFEELAKAHPKELKRVQNAMQADVSGDAK